MSAVLSSTGRIVCHCLRVTEEEILQAAEVGKPHSVKQIMDHTGAGGGCTACHFRIRALLNGEQSQCDSSSSQTCVTM
ncbi:MAG: (2Fe-2S)-binding protein [Planctomycetaceae bacterium]